MQLRSTSQKLVIDVGDESYIVYELVLPKRG